MTFTLYCQLFLPTPLMDNTLADSVEIVHLLRDVLLKLCNQMDGKNKPRFVRLVP